MSLHDIVEFLGIEQARRGSLDRRWRIQRDDVEFPVAAQQIAAAVIDDDVSLRITDHIFEIRKEETERLGHRTRKFDDRRIDSPALHGHDFPRHAKQMISPDLALLLTASGRCAMTLVIGVKNVMPTPFTSNRLPIPSPYAMTVAT